MQCTCKILEHCSWRQVMTNCQLKLFEGGDAVTQPGKDMNRVVTSPTSTSDTRLLVKRIIHVIQRLPGKVDGAK